MLPLVTVFMAAYNAEAHIQYAIESILNQSYQDFELLIVDDGSTDSTVKIVNSYTDQRIRLIQNSKNEGLIYTRNIALTEAQGKLLAILDSDDIATPNRLAIQVSEFSKRPRLGILGSPATVIDQWGQQTGRRLEQPTGAQKVFTTLLFRNPIVHSSMMLRMEAFKQIGGYQNHPYAEDYDLIIRIAYHYEIDNFPQPLVAYRMHEASTSSIYKYEMAHQLYLIKKEQIDYLKANLDPTILLEHPAHNKLSLADYRKSLSELIQCNRVKAIYPRDYLEKSILDLWFEAILYKSDKNSCWQFFDRRIFSWKHVRFKQIRKVVKLAFKK